MSKSAAPPIARNDRGNAGEVFLVALRLGLTSFGGPIAHLGYFDFTDLFGMVAELELILSANGVPVKLGAGVAAVQQVYAEIAITKRETVNA